MADVQDLELYDPLPLLLICEVRRQDRSMAGLDPRVHMPDHPSPSCGGVATLSRPAPRFWWRYPQTQVCRLIVVVFLRSL
jgi:hypothetical protein